MSGPRAREHLRRLLLVLVWVLVTAGAASAGGAAVLPLGTFPDIVVTAATTVRSASPGQQIAVSHTVKNTGAVAAESFRVRFYLSRDAVLDSADVALGSLTLSLSAGASRTSAKAVTIPLGTAPRVRYRILVHADADGARQETNETNNVRATAAITIGRDLEVATAATVGATMPGESIVVDSTVTNSGAVAAGSFRIGFYLSTDRAFNTGDTLVGSRTVTSLAAGASVTARKSVTIPAQTPPGSGYRILVRADIDRTLAEASEANNLRPTGPITIGLDLAVTAASTVAAATAGKSIPVSHTVQNTGGAAVGRFKVDFYLSADTTLGPGDVLLGTRTVETLAQDAPDARSRTVTIPATTPRGKYRVLVRADAQGDVTEADETNNVRATEAITIRPPRPIVAIDDRSHVIFLPYNCSISFQISNVGPPGTVMDYQVADDGSLGGFLVVNNAVGALPAGDSATIIVAVKPEFTDMPGATLVLSIYTPAASNFIKSLVSVRVVHGVRPVLGLWNGTWSGHSVGRHDPGQPEPTAPVSGGWTLDLQGIDRANQTAFGTLTWYGTDAYWTYVRDSEFRILSATPQPFIADRTIVFDASNAAVDVPTAGSDCTFQLTIEGFAGAANPSDEFYGPYFSARLNPSTGIATSERVGVGFAAHPYHPETFDTAISFGAVTGRQEP